MSDVRKRPLPTPAAAILASALSLCAATPEQIEFFEKRVRPVLAASCYACHSGATASPMGGLRVDSRDALLKGGKSGAAIVPGDAARSRLVQALKYDGAVKMPPSGRLAPEQIADLEAWIKMGAPQPEPRATYGRIDWEQARQFWSFRPVVKPAVPRVKRGAWVRSPVDAFLLTKLEEKGLAPAPEADRRSLIRRVTFDLTGLPPTPAEVEAFVNDRVADAFEKVVERLLASPHYGERWARHWLDLVRYAETNGHEYDNDKTDPWRYRDYVIRAFNQDVPYDRFVREHIAGDLLPDPRPTPDGAALDSPVATAFFWFGEVLNSATDPVKSRADEVDNQIDVAGKAFLGLTVACARCHDHKFDPIPTADYYSMAGVFHSTDMRETVVDSPERAKRLEALSAEIRKVSPRPAPPRAAQWTPRPADTVFQDFERGFGDWIPAGAAFGAAPIAGAADSLAAGSDVFVGSLTSRKFRTTDKLFLHVRVSGTKVVDKNKERTPLRFTIVNAGYKSQHVVPEGPKPVWKTLRLTFERNRICWFEILDRSREGHIRIHDVVFSDDKQPPATAPEPEVPEFVSHARDLEAQAPESAFAMVSMEDSPRDVRIHQRGSHLNLGDPAPRRFLQVVAGADQPRIAQGSGRREIAAWFAGAGNPLTARVMVNRVWKHHFGQGLVRTLDNFGASGDRPTHPELLDYLAARFVESGWSVKAMHRLMVLSSAYRMGGGERMEADPENKLLHRMPVRRLEAEAIRDAMLAVAGTLRPELHGPSVPPHISAHQDGRGKPVSGPLDGAGRRSIYVQVRRNFLTPMLLAFDYPLPISTIGARGVSTVPSQALLLLNNEFVAQQAKAWAARDAGKADGERIAAMYQAAFARAPEPAEASEILAFLDRQSAMYGARDERVWADVAHVLFNSPEFVYVR